MSPQVTLQIGKNKPCLGCLGCQPTNDDVTLDQWCKLQKCSSNSRRLLATSQLSGAFTTVQGNGSVTTFGQNVFVGTIDTKA